jgi:PleD family two-component response regulator
MKRGIETLCDVPCDCQLMTDSRCAVVLPDCDRRQAVSLARTLLDAVPMWVLERSDANARIACSAGVATLTTPSRSSRPDDLTDAADRCLFAAQRAGGSVVKSIDVL